MNETGVHDVKFTSHQKKLKKKDMYKNWLGMVVHASNPSTQEAKAGGSL